jgi:ATP-dependent Clp protease protease subunit
MLVEATGKTLAEITKDADRNYWMSADEAKKYGIIDDVLKPKKK